MRRFFIAFFLISQLLFSKKKLLVLGRESICAYTAIILVHRSYIVALNKLTTVTKNALTVADLNITVGEQYKMLLMPI